METSLDSTPNASYELAWSAKYTAMVPLDQSPVVISVQLREGRHQPDTGPSEDRTQRTGPAEPMNRKRKCGTPRKVKTRPRARTSRIWTPSTTRSRGSNTTDTPTALESEEQWNLQNGNDDIVQQSLRTMHQE